MLASPPFRLRRLSAAPRSESHSIWEVFLAASNDMQNNAHSWMVESRRRLAQRRAGKPATKAGQIRALWPEIAAALENGQSVKSIRQWLEEDAGLFVGITSLTSYISRIRRRKRAIEHGQKPLASVECSTPAVVQANRTQDNLPQRLGTAAASDPIAQAMDALTKQRMDIRKLHSDGDPTGKSLI